MLKFVRVKDSIVKIFICAICIFGYSGIANSQTFKMHDFQLKNFGFVSIPVELDTLSQTLAKNSFMLTKLE